MSTRQQTSRQPVAPFEEIYAQLQKIMGDIGLAVGVWGPDGASVLQWRPCSQFTQALEQAGADVEQACRKAAVIAATQGRPVADLAVTGHCLVAVPVRRRRRLVAGVAASFPVRRMVDEEALARLCHKYQLDLTTMKSLSREVRFQAEQQDVFLTVLESTLLSLQARREAGEDIMSFSKNLASTYEELSLLYRISGSMLVSRQPVEFMQNICDELLGVMNISAAAAMAFAHPPALDEDVAVTSGPLRMRSTVLDLIQREISPRLAEEPQMLLSNNYAPPSGKDGEQQVSNIIAVPLVSDEETIGLLVGVNKIDAEFDSVDMKLINAVANQTSVFLANNRLYADIQDLLMGVLHALTATIDAKDPYTSGHSQRVALISKRLAEQCGFDPEKVQQIYLAGLLHDIGKIGVPEAILCKKGKLTDEEYEDMKRHPMLGANILGGIRQLDEVVVGILSHHERPDGGGYPRGLHDNQIPLEGKIICVADCFDAMTSYRTYRNALPLETVVQELKDNAGTQFDEDLIEKFLSIDLKAFMEEIHQPARTVFPFTPRQARARDSRE
jgi:putative nucleotidyltransferase with HDIG domain